MPNQPDDGSPNLLEKIYELALEFRKQLSGGKKPKIERYLTQISDEGGEKLFSQLLDMEVSYRHRKGKSPSTDEYVKRFPQFKNQVRRAFFEPTMGSVDSSASTDGDDQTASLRSPGRDADALEPTFELPDANRVGDYELIRKLGQGGMGIVYEAVHTKTNNRVALKTLLTGGDGQQINADKLYRFRKEFRRLSEINHPNLVGMQSLEVDRDRWFFTMDLIDGEDFLSYVRPDDQLDEDRLRSCLKQLATGVLELHRRGIIHRDLKPSNVLVSREGHVTILDFGLAAQLQRSADMTQTKSGMFAGTPPYAAPEQMFGERTEASDWYAFGTMLFEALAGERPFKDPDPMKLLRIKQEQDPPQLSNRDGLPNDLSALADGLLRREPGLRFLRDAIGAALGLEEDTRSPGSTRGSQGSAGSEDLEDAELEEFEEEEIVLVGRDKQLAQMEEIRQKFLETRQPHVVWITGLSGEGKSSLVEAFLRPLRKGDEMLVLSGRCYDRESVPFKVIDSQIDALVSFLRSRSDSEVEAWLPNDIEMLARLFPLLRRVKAIDRRSEFGRTYLEDRQVRNLAFAAFKDLLFTISQSTPIAMFVDDLQWGDADSAEVLASLLIPPASPSVLLLGSFRTDEMDESSFLREWQAQLERKHEYVRIMNVSVDPLTEEECVALVQARLGNNDIERLREHALKLLGETKGNPYFLEQFLEGYDATSGTFSPVPLSEAVGAKLTRCPGDARELLDAIAVFGKAIPVADVVDVVGNPKSAMSTLVHMRSERLVRLVGSNVDQTVDTYHDKIRETAFDQMSDRRRTQLHSQIAESVERRIASTDEDEVIDSAERVFDLAHHFYEANDPRAFDYQLKSGKRALATFAMENAVDHLRKAKARIRDDATRDIEFELYFSLGKALSASHILDEAIDHFEVALKLAGAPLEKANCHYAVGGVLWRLGRYDDAHDRYRLAFSEVGEPLPASDAGRYVRAVSNMFLFHLVPRWALVGMARRTSDELDFLSNSHALLNWTVVQLRTSDFMFHIARSCVIAKCSRNSRLASEAYAAYATMLSMCGFGWFAVPIVKLAEKHASVSRRDDDAGIFDVNAFDTYYMLGHHIKAEEYARRAIERLERSGHYHRSHIHHGFWHLWSVRGNVNSLIKHATREFEIGQESNDHVVCAWGLYGIAEGLARQGQVDRALDLVDKSLEILNEKRSWSVTIAKAQKAKVLVQAGDYQSAKEVSREVMREYTKLRLVDFTAFGCSLYVEACLGSDWWSPSRPVEKRNMRSASWVAFFSRRVGFLFPNARPQGFRVSGRACVARRNKRRALKYFSKAIAASSKINADYEHARALIDKSMIEYPEAITDRERGLDLLESLGCVLPDVEIEYLGIDRETHHRRAADARGRNSHKEPTPVFDLEAWEKDHGQIVTLVDAVNV